MNKLKLILSIIWEEGILPLIAYGITFLLLFGIPIGLFIGLCVFISHVFGDTGTYIMGGILVLLLLAGIVLALILYIIEWIQKILIPKYKEKLKEK